MDIEMHLQKLAFFRCVHENFMDGCGNYLLEVVSENFMDGCGNYLIEVVSKQSQCVPYTKSIIIEYICYNKGVKGG